MVGDLADPRRVAIATDGQLVVTNPSAGR